MCEISNELKDEVQSANSTPQSTSTETEPNSVSSTTNDTTNRSSSQAIKEVREAVKFPNFYKGNFFQHNLFAKFANIVRFNGTNHIYRGSTSGTYVYDDELIEFALQKSVPKFGFSQIKEEVQHLNIATKMSERTESPSNFVGLANGVYDITTSNFKGFKDCTPTDFILTNKLSVDYSSNIPTSNEPVDTLLNEATGNDLELELYVWEVSGACLCRCSLPSAFALTGDSSTNGNDGRDILIDMLRASAGECASFETLQELTTDKTFHSLYSKSCNISNEQYPTKVSNINKLVGLIRGNKVLPTKEFGGLTFTPYTTLLFNVRDIRDFDGVFSDLGEYIKVIPFKNQLNVDKSFRDTLLASENLQYFTFKALSAFSKVLERGSFTIPKVVEEATRNYLLNNNSAREFIECNKIFHIVRKSVYYKEYIDWCDDNNKRPVDCSQFGKEVVKFGYLTARYSTSMGKRPCYYTVRDFNIDKLFNKYSGYLEAKSMELILRDNGTYSKGDFIEAFIDYFRSNSPEDISDDDIAEVSVIDNTSQLDTEMSEELQELGEVIANM